VTYATHCSVNTQLAPLQCKYFLGHDAITLLLELELPCCNVHVSVQVKHCLVKITNKSKGYTGR